MSNNNYSLLGNIILRGKLECLTPLHIGGSKDKFEIGGVDSPVIKDPASGHPYIPGSSLKGKLRSLLEFALGKVSKVVDKNGNEKYPPSDDPEITNLFGSSANETTFGPTRLIVRDAFPDNDTIELWKSADTEIDYVEIKAENTIDRMSSKAMPRFLERVLKGSRFDVEFVLQVYSNEEDKGKSNFEKLVTALRLLEDNTLGGGGSRGSGKVKFYFEKPFVVSDEDYKNGTGNFNKEKAEPKLETSQLKYDDIDGKDNLWRS